MSQFMRILQPLLHYEDRLSDFILLKQLIELLRLVK